MEGSAKGVWKFKNPASTTEAVETFRFRSNRLSNLSPQDKAPLSLEVEKELAGYQLDAPSVEYGLSLAPTTAVEFSNITRFGVLESSQVSFSSRIATEERPMVEAELNQSAPSLPRG